MQSQHLAKIIQAIEAHSVSHVDTLQSLWGGYGELVRVYLTGHHCTSVIVKHIQFPQPKTHPRGWATDLSHQRKLKSYQIESYWYQHYAHLCKADSCVPKCLWIETSEHETLLILEDLAVLGFNRVNPQPTQAVIQAGFTWLAHFHGQFMQHTGEGLWPIGSYWHLATRPDELAALQDIKLKNAAIPLDNLLNNCPFQTVIHGDAKLANFCFTPDLAQAAAVDFQYIGKGCGMKDVVYFLSSVMAFNQPTASIEQAVQLYIDFYFEQLALSTNYYHPTIDLVQLEKTWRPLYAIAWADFHRFIKGWSPEHPKINAYSETLTLTALAQLAAENSDTAKQ
ncbi:ecdysteroid 22-kinase family protein [Shewanella subflava]|uniref:Ecdysteroid 22-kinase family protein n=1 Tax=Shewanella subflava TaxID=2986476 RepID=A0ABT3I9R7_9GAMM|nr:ecdysteroid 22-kinase family protein [Shewanella subflava]MCW3172802.1 ecdysteroid 22-kinase family protein [Shewanella subflava]